MDDAQHSLQRKLEQERRHLACLCAGFALPHGHGDEADNARDEMAELLAWSHANLCAARIRALEGLLGDLRCSGRRLCMDCGEEIPLSRLRAGPYPKDLPREREGAEVSFPLFPLREGRDRGHAATVQGSGA